MFDALTDPVRGLAKADESKLLLGAEATRASILGAASDYKRRLRHTRAITSTRNAS